MLPKTYDDFHEDMRFTRSAVLLARDAGSPSYDALLAGITEITGEVCAAGDSQGHVRRQWDKLSEKEIASLVALFTLLFPEP